MSKPLTRSDAMLLLVCIAFGIAAMFAMRTCGGLVEEPGERAGEIDGGVR